jgi:hypothetical protein
MAAHVGVFPATVASGVTQATALNSAAIGAGNTVLVVMRASGTHSCSDSVNGTYTQLDYDTSSLNHSDWIFQNTGAAASGAVTLTCSGTTSGTIRLAGDIFSGVATTGQPFGHSFVSGGITSGQTTTTATAIASDPGGNVVWAAPVSATANVTFTAGSSNGVSETIGTQTGTASGSVATEYATSTAAGSQASTITWSAATSNGDQMFQAILTAAGTNASSSPPGAPGRASAQSASVLVSWQPLHVDIAITL